MKKFINLLIVATLVTGVASCKKDGPDTPGGGGGDTGSVTLTELTDATINGTAIASESTAAGLITSSASGKGIPGVAVTDGYTFVKTDENGVYQMVRNPKSRNIYYTTPAGYKICLDDQKHLPCFFTPGILESSKKYRADFTLVPLTAPETEFTLLMIGDPQCYISTEAARYKTETIKDIKATADKYKNCYAVTLGDITFDSFNMWETMAKSMANVQSSDGRYIPFFQCIGNHDHNSLEKDTGNYDTNDYNAVLQYVKTFGPTDYSFDRGDAHIIVMDDIPVTTLDSSSKPNGKTWNYNAGFSDAQYKWFQQDIANVENISQKVGFICLHIPFRAGASSGGASVNKNRHYQDFLNQMKKFKEFHIMIGHTHYQQNYIHDNQLTAGGHKIYEHVHGAACGAWWASDCNVTGAPNGYTIYTVKGANVKNWIMKGSNHDESYQLRVWDGDQTYSGNMGYKYQWYNTANTYASITAKGFTEAKGCLIAEVFNDDKANWKVEFWQNGSKAGDFKRKADSGIMNIPVVAYWFNNKGKTTSTWSSGTSSHYWYYKPASGTPAEQKNWEVRAIQTIPTNTAQVNTYSCSELTTDYKCFEK